MGIHAGNEDPHFIVRVLETQNSQSKSVYFVTLQGNSLEGQACLVSTEGIYKPNVWPSPIL